MHRTAHSPAAHRGFDASFGPDRQQTASRFSGSVLHQRRAHQIIPGGAHTYAKGDDQYPEGLAPVIDHGHGCRAWDVDGNEYIEFGAGVRSVTLGHAYPRVCRAAQRAMWEGTNFARPHRLELEAAETFLACVPAAQMVKFAKKRQRRDDGGRQAGAGHHRSITRGRLS